VEHLQGLWPEPAWAFLQLLLAAEYLAGCDQEDSDRHVPLEASEKPTKSISTGVKGKNRRNKTKIPDVV
jgi:hypothetical protein